MSHGICFFISLFIYDLNHLNFNENMLYMVDVVWYIVNDVYVHTLYMVHVLM